MRHAQPLTYRLDIAAVLGIILLFLIILTTGSPLAFSYSKSLNVIGIIVTLVALGIVYRSVRGYLYPLAIPVFVVIALLLGINWLISSLRFGGSMGPYINLLIRMVYAYLVLTYFSGGRAPFVPILRQTLMIIMYLAIAGFLLQFIINADTLPEYDFNGLQGTTFGHLAYYSQIMPALGIYRAQGILWEPGVLQIFLNLLLFINLFYMPRRAMPIILNLLALVMTFSTTGMIVTLIIFGYYSYRQGWITFSPKKIALAVIILGTLGTLLYYNASAKFSLEESRSFVWRLYDYEKSLTVAGTEFATGIGLDSDTYTGYPFDSKILGLTSDLLAGLIDEERGNSNSIMMLVVQFGLIYFLGFILVLAHQRLIPGHRTMILLLIVIFCMSEPLILNNFFLLFFLSGMIALIQRVLGQQPLKSNHTARERAEVNIT